MKEIDFYYLVILFIHLGAFLLLRFRFRRLKTMEKELNTLVESRTRDLKKRNIELENAHVKLQHSSKLIEAKNRQLEAQWEKLKELDEIKSRFFANISHEFRTPLTLIKGPLEEILSDSRDKKIKSKAQLMLNNSHRLLNLVDQLLELAKFESGKMKLQASLQNIVPFVNEIVMWFESLARQNKLDLTFHAEQQVIPLYFDPGKLEKVVSNLLSNAFKNTPAHGKRAPGARRNR
jgi:signal transduction histidine kinase